MKVKDAAGHAIGGVVAVEATDDLRATAQVLVEEEVGAVVVYDTGGSRGIFSERDLARAVADGADLEEERVSEYMTEAPVTISEEAPLGEAVELMHEHAVRHLVVTRDGDIVGMLSARDVLRALSPRPSLT